jgi:hemoglobin
VAAETATASQTPASDSLYQRIGGYDAIAAAVDQFIAGAFADPRLAVYFKGLNTDDKRKVRQLTVDYLSALSGGPTYYTGRDLRRAHAGLGITAEEWDIAAGYLAQAIGTLNLGEGELRELQTLFAHLRDEVVEVS